MFKPCFTITNKIASDLMTLESLRIEIEALPITVSVLKSLRETSKMQSVHYSTQIEGNKLTQKEIADVIVYHKTVGKERDEKEVWGYYKALSWLEEMMSKKTSLSEKIIQQLHALVMNNKVTKPTPYRDGQNVIRDGIANPR